MTTPYARLKRWRDVGDGPVTYCAGDAEFSLDVQALLQERDEMLAALQLVSGLHGFDDLTDAWGVVRPVIAKAFGAQS